MKKLYQVLVVIDDFADTPQLHKPHGALDTLFIRGRHTQVSTWVSSQKLRLRVNMQFLCCWRLRNQHELDAAVEELSALLPQEQLYRLYEQATREPYSFLFAYYLKPRNEMFYKRFEERFALEKDADGSGAQLPGPEAVRQLRSVKTSPAAPPSQPSSRPSSAGLKKRMTTIYVDSRKRVAGSDSDFEVDLGESLHLQSDARLAVYKIRLADSFLSTDRGRYLYWVDAALNWALLPECVHWCPVGRLDQLQLWRDHEQSERSLRRQPLHERPGLQQPGGRVLYDPHQGVKVRNDLKGGEHQPKPCRSAPETLCSPSSGCRTGLWAQISTRCPGRRPPSPPPRRPCPPTWCRRKVPGVSAFLKSKITATTMKTRTFIGPDFFSARKKRSRTSQ